MVEICSSYVLAERENCQVVPSFGFDHHFSPHAFPVTNFETQYTDIEEFFTQLGNGQSIGNYETPLDPPKDPMKDSLEIKLEPRSPPEQQLSPGSYGCSEFQASPEQNDYFHDPSSSIDFYPCATEIPRPTNLNLSTTCPMEIPQAHLKWDQTPYFPSIKQELFDLMDATSSPAMIVPDACQASPCYASSNESSVSTPEIENLELYHDLIMPWIAHDISTQSMRWGIPQDPRHWNMEDSRLWWMNTAKSQGFNCDQMDLLDFNFSGPQLCQMSQDQFRQLDSICGDRMYGCWQMWNTAVDYSRSQQEQMSANACRIMPSNRSDTSLACQAGSSIQGAGSCFALQHSVSSPDLSISPSVMSESGCESFANGSSSAIQLWRFIRQLLEVPSRFSHVVHWVDEENGIFKIQDSRELAQLWGRRKNRPAMNYDKLSRSLRQYYKKGILTKTSRAQRLVYQFCPTYRQAPVVASSWSGQP